MTLVTTLTPLATVSTLTTLTPLSTMTPLSNRDRRCSRRSPPAGASCPTRTPAP